MTNDHRDQAPRSVARDARASSPAEEVARLLAELHQAVETRERVPRYRRVKRGPGRQVAVLDWAIHRTREPGLLAQLGTIARRADQAPVDVFRWERDPDDPCRRDYGDERDTRECPHGRWVRVRTEQRPVPGVVVAGAAVPSGSAGWDADGALSPLATSGQPGAAEPVTDAWHVGQEVARELAALADELVADGHDGTLVDAALADEDTGRRIAARLRALVARARVAAGYDAPVVTLRDVCCPACGGPLMVRADASSAVWCGGVLPVAGPAPADDPDCVPLGWAPCGARWPRGGWVQLLEDLDPAEPAEPPRNDHRRAQGRPAAAPIPDPADVDEVPAVLAGLVHHTHRRKDELMNSANERVEVLVQLTHRGLAHVLIGSSEEEGTVPAEDIARDADLPENELPGRRFSAVREGGRLRDFRLLNDPRL